MSVSHWSWGTTKPHGPEGPRPVDRFRIEGSQLAIELISYGAHLVRVETPDRSGRVENIILSLDTLAQYEDRARNPYLGASVGRNANRLAHAQLPIGTQVHALSPNEGPHQLHGGPEGFDRHVWRSEVLDDFTVAFSLASEDGDQGFPGRVEARATYRLEGAALSIVYEAKTDRPTLVNLTNHAYWNLAAGGDVRDHRLRMRSSSWQPVDADQLPVGPPEPVEGTTFDFRSAAPLSQRAEGYDHCFLLDDPSPARPSLELVDRRSGRKLTLATNQRALQLYTMPSGGSRAVCLETQMPIDAPHCLPERDWLLSPGERYTSETIVRFGAAAQEGE